MKNKMLICTTGSKALMHNAPIWGETAKVYCQIHVYGRKSHLNARLPVAIKPPFGLYIQRYTSPNEIFQQLSLKSNHILDTSDNAILSNCGTELVSFIFKNNSFPSSY